MEYEYPVIDLKATGKRIKELRLRNNLSVEDVSHYMGFESIQAVYKWQRGESLPSIDSLYALSKLFRIPMDEILIGNKEEDMSPLLPFYANNNQNQRLQYINYCNDLRMTRNIFKLEHHSSFYTFKINIFS